MIIGFEKNDKRVVREVLAIIAMLLIWAGINPFQAETPLDEKIPKGVVSEIECKFKADESQVMKGTKYVPDKGVFHYRVFVPKEYEDEGKDRYLCLFIASQGGNAGMENVKDRAEKDRWIVVMLVESKNGPTEPNLGNFLAAHDDVIQRFRIHENLKFGTGFSGGARFSTIWPLWRPGFAGLILQGAGFWWNDNGYLYESPKKEKDLLICGIFGADDTNHTEIKKMENELPNSTQRHFITIPGGHMGASREAMDDAFDWIYQHIYTKKSLTKEAVLMAQEYYSRKLIEARQLEDGVDKLDKMEQVHDFIKNNRVKDLGEEKDVPATLIKEMAKLKKNPAVRKELEAKAAYFKVQSEEGKVREKNPSKKTLAKKIGTIIKSYSAISARYEGTTHGERAKAKSEAILKEFEEYTGK